jgi:Cd2+/Zn2+-exporting ATPase
MVNYIKKREGKFNEHERTRVWIRLAVVMGLTIVLAGLLDLTFQGVPLGFTIPLFNESASLSRIMYHASVIVVGLYIGFIGLKKLIFEERFSVELLMSVVALSATYLDFLFEGATVLFLYSLSEHFEDYIQERAIKTVEELSRYIPDKARALVDGSEIDMNVKDVKPGMTILVKPGERIAFDGTVVEGASTVDQSLVTGESMPLLRKSGDEVYAGTLNLSGVLKVVVKKTVEDTLVSRIIRLVLESRKRKTSIEKLVDKFARVYVPIVISLAVFVALFGPYIAGGSFQTWIYRSLVLLVVSCPSAFVISVPATIFTAVTIASRKGVIIKGGLHIEKMANVKAVAFDKTGTLTLGTPVVHEVKAAGKLDLKTIAYAAALEQFSNHPIAKAIVKRAVELGLPFNNFEVRDVKEILGKGILGRVDEELVIIGNMDLMREYSCNCEKINPFYEDDKHTFVCISINKIVEASVCLVDDVRQDALETVNALKKIGVHVAMLTGDKQEIAKEIAEKLGINEVYAELLPEDKLTIIKRMKENYGLIAMVGDGVNDAPALAVSDVGIAMSGSGVDLALESADIILAKDELIQVPYLIKLSQKTVSIAKQNIAISLGVKILLGALGLAGFSPLWFTVAAGDDGLTMLVLLNNLRLTRLKL